MSLQQESVEEIAASLADQLSMLYPSNLDTLDENDTQKNVDLILNRIQEENADEEELRNAIPKAIAKWKKINQNATNKKEVQKKSFSLFDQLQSFQLPVSLEEIKEASSAKERLAAFKKISFLDDLLMDWNEIKPLLMKDLQENDESDTKLEILNLHRKWFHDGRCSSEYLQLQYELCQNLLNIVMNQKQNPSFETGFLFKIVQTWCDLFLDIMQRGLYSRELVETMEKQFMLLLRDRNQLLALADNRTRWFQAWTILVPKDILIELLEECALVPDFIKMCSTVPQKGSVDDYERRLSLYMQGVASLAAILEKIRLIGFLKLNKFKESVDSILEIFLNAIALDEGDDWRLICYNALQVILSGCKEDGNSEFEKRLDKVRAGTNMATKEVQRVWDISL